jgi:hypothetical protein
LVTLTPPPAAASASTSLTPSEEIPNEVVIRLALPYMPSLKTLAEIGTMEYMRTMFPEIPIPRVIAYEAGAGNVLGAEWILMSKVSNLSITLPYLQHHSTPILASEPFVEPHR